MKTRDKNIMRTKTWWQFFESKSGCITFTRSQHTFAFAKQLPHFCVASVCDFCLRKLCGSVFALRASHVTEWKEQQKKHTEKNSFWFLFWLFIYSCVHDMIISALRHFLNRKYSQRAAEYFSLFFLSFVFLFLSFHITDCGYNANESIKAMWEH